MKIVMKKILLMLMFMMGISHGQANTNNHYLTFELTDGAKVSVLVSSDISLSFNGTTLFVCKELFSLVNLKRMYFSLSDETTTGIAVPSLARSEDIEEIFDLKGQKVNRSQIRRGVYIVKSKKGTFKIFVQ